MTAEIAVMNKMAIALAADSAITFGRGEEQKIYNTGNKLFSLSKYHPVGVMIYGNAEFMGIPWETIIKYYRAKLGTTKFGTLKEYAENLVSFLEHENALMFTDKLQEDFFRGTVNGYLGFLKSVVDEQVTAILQQEQKISKQKIEEIVSGAIDKHFGEWEAAERLPSFPETYEQEILKKYGSIIEQQKQAVLKKLPLSADSSAKLTQICASLFSKDRFSSNISGLVIAGFGDQDIFPSLICFTLQVLVNNKLKYKVDRQEKAGHHNDAIIMPFAQSEMVTTFVEGIDPFYSDTFQGYLTELFSEYPNYIIKEIPQLTDEKKTDLTSKLQEVTRKILADFFQKIDSYKNEEHVAPILAAVAALPKDELAAMAESLVTLTSFKRRVSLQAETVGGPIDVAVISKGDGFVWIKRKHYFKPDLNQSFFSNYYREN